MTPLHLAAAFGDFYLPCHSTRMTECEWDRMTEHGWERVDRMGDRILSNVYWCEKDILSIEAMVTARTERGWTPLHMAAMFREDNFDLTWGWGADLYL